MQNCLQKRTEYKVVLHNKVAQYVNFDSKTNGQFAPTRDIMKFAERAVQALSERCPGCILDGLVRADIMATASVVDNTTSPPTKRMVLNEFENLDARFFGGANEMNSTQTFLHNYWMEKLREYVALLNNMLVASEVMVESESSH